MKMNHRSTRKQNEKALNLLYILPMFIVFVTFIIYPITQVFYMSFFERRVNGEMLFVGLKNFITIFTDERFTPTFFNAIKNNLKYYLYEKDIYIIIV